MWGMLELASRVPWVSLVSRSCLRPQLAEILGHLRKKIAGLDASLWMQSEETYGCKHRAII